MSCGKDRKRQEKTGKDRKRQEKTGKRFEVRGDAEEPSDRELEKFPFRRQTGSRWGFLSD